MFESIYIGLTGLSTFSRNLTVIGNNVSNMNTPGFKSSQLSFSELVYRNAVSEGTDGSGQLLQVGSGVGTGGTRVLFKQGDPRQTGRDTDLAINGGGFFVLRDAEGKTSYTRSGDFSFDADGFLVAASGARVAALGGGDISVSDLRSVPPKATSSVRLVDNLSSGDSSHDVNVTVFDAAGGSHALKLHFTNNSTVVPRSWLLEVRNETNTLISSGEVRFNGDGSPAGGFDTHSFTLNTQGVPSSAITLDLGPANLFSGVTNFSAGADSTLKVASQDGLAAGSLSKTTFDADGVLVASYSNGQTRRGQQVALAAFQNPQDLELAGAGSFENRSGQRVTLGAAHSGGFGAIAAQSLESANVDLAGQFSELIISQRGYQASSQVISTANDMIQQLFDIKKR